MNDRDFQEYKPVVKFYNLNNYIYFEYNNNKVIADINTIQDLIDELKYPCKITFDDIPIDYIAKIIDLFAEDDFKSFCYKEKDTLIYNVIIMENEKIKKL